MDPTTEAYRTILRKLRREEEGIKRAIATVTRLMNEGPGEAAPAPAEPRTINMPRAEAAPLAMSLDIGAPQEPASAPPAAKEEGPAPEPSATFPAGAPAMAEVSQGPENEPAREDGRRRGGRSNKELGITINAGDVVDKMVAAISKAGPMSAAEVAAAVTAKGYPITGSGASMAMRMRPAVFRHFADEEGKTKYRLAVEGEEPAAIPTAIREDEIPGNLMRAARSILKERTMSAREVVNALEDRGIKSEFLAKRAGGRSTAWALAVLLPLVSGIRRVGEQRSALGGSEAVWGLAEETAEAAS